LLVSHKKKFIFLKTAKTAGTSVEIFFEEFCVAEPISYEIGQERTNPIVSDIGIVGARRGRKLKIGKIFGGFHSKFYNHKPAKSLRRALGRKIWDDYFKFTIVRNPFDQLVSKFWYKNNSRRDELIAKGFDEVKAEFKTWLFSQKLGNSRIFLIDGEPAVDYFIRYESLEQGVLEVCSYLGIDKDVSELQTFKGGIRPKSDEFSAFADYYDAASEEYVNQTFSWEIERFGYSLD
jgi:hypothetical protein